MELLIVNIHILVQIADTPVYVRKGKEMANLPTLQNAWLWIKDGIVIDFGRMENCPERPNAQRIDATGRLVCPGFVDSHTHLVFAASREGEFVDRIKGLTYEQIAQNGGGILNSAKKLQQTSEDELFESALKRIEEIIGYGTAAVEIKSGYGLTLQDEIKMLRVIRRLKQVSPIMIKATFLGAHAIPKSYENRKDYIDLVVDWMIPQVAREGLADYCDVFCDKGFFTPQETDRILRQAIKFGMRPKIHANELDYSGGIQVGVMNQAISVDHLEFTGDEEINTLLESTTMPVLLPGTAFFLGLHYPPARKMIDSGLPVALASDYNPGSCPCGNVTFMMSLACVQMKMLPEEAINAATVNAAKALELEETHGRIQRGLQANLFITKPMQGYAFIPYSFASNQVETVILNGKVWSK